MIESLLTQQSWSDKWKYVSDDIRSEISNIFKTKQYIHLIDNSTQLEKIEFMTHASSHTIDIFLETHKDKLTKEKKRMSFLRNFWRFFPGMSDMNIMSRMPRMSDITQQVELLLWDDRKDIEFRTMNPEIIYARYYPIYVELRAMGYGHVELTG